MANVNFISGSYKIPALSTETFTFWWPAPQLHGKNYFNVSIAPQRDRHDTMKPLRELKREWLYMYEAGAVNPDQWRLQLTLQNDNDFEIRFLANHVQVY